MSEKNSEQKALKEIHHRTAIAEKLLCLVHAVSKSVVIWSWILGCVTLVWAIAEENVSRATSTLLMSLAFFSIATGSLGKKTKIPALWGTFFALASSFAVVGIFLGARYLLHNSTGMR